jgi:hypothetical protein
LRSWGKTVRRKAFGDTSGTSSLVTGKPDGVGTDRNVGTPAIYGSGKEIVFGFQPTPVNTQGFQQRRTEWHLAIAATLALVNANHHALAVDIGGFQLA